MDQVTTVLGQELRQFWLCDLLGIQNHRLPKEAATRAVDVVARRHATSIQQQTFHAGKKAQESAKNRRAKTLNLFIYKVHALGDYVETIRRLGTTDSFSTQIVSLSLVPIWYTIFVNY